jgi:uncharacterized protein (UPF0128 family)
LSKISEEWLEGEMKKRKDVSEQILDLAVNVFDKKEVNQLSSLLSNFILGPYYRVQYKAHLPEKYKEYPVLGRQQVRRRVAKETPYSDKLKD